MRGFLLPTIILAVFGGFFGVTEATDAQDLDLREVIVSLELEQVPLKKALKEIEGQTDLTFAFSYSAINPDRKVSVEVHDKSVEVVLKHLFKEQWVSWGLSGKAILLKKWAEPEQDTPELAIEEPVAGQVIDSETGETLPGVNILVKGTTIGTSTDRRGNFKLTVPSLEDTLIISFIGYQTQEIAIAGRTEIDIALQPRAIAGGELVVVGYGTQEKATVTAAVSSVEGGEIVNTPAANVSTSIAGRVPGILSTQESGEPGSDETIMRIRGIGTQGDVIPLVVVDGIPSRGFNQLNPNAIESITVLKDPAAIAPYGMAGANGVILVTTKRGKKGEISMSYDGWAGFQRPTQFPDYLNAYEEASLLNQANENVGSPLPFTEEDLQKFRSGSNPNTHPNHDWVREVMNFKAPMTSHNLTLTGGTDKVRYFGSLGYLFQEGVVDVVNFSRYTLASNVDIDATPTTTVSLDIRGRVTEKNEPGFSSGNAIHTTITKESAYVPLQFTNGHPGHELLPRIYESGYGRNNGNNFQSQLSIEQHISGIPGLTLKGVAAFDRGYSHTKDWQTGFTFYQLNEESEQVPVNGGIEAPQLEEEFSQDQRITLQGYLNYTNDFGKHYITALGVAETRRGKWNNLMAGRRNYGLDFDEIGLGSTDPSDFSTDGASGESRQMGLVTRLSYHYDYRYMFEFSGRYDGHYYFAPGERFAFFPAVSVGWALSEERFMQDNFSWINYLKLRASLGESGNLAGGPFQYLGSYGITDSYIFGGAQIPGVYERSEPNPNITWETARKIDIGLEGELWQGQLGFEADLFWERRSDMLLRPNAVVPVEYGIGISQLNAGIMENRGVEFSLNTSHQFSKGPQLNAEVNFTYARNKLIEVFETESTLNNPNRSRTGKPLDTQFGLRALGLFQSEQEIENHATQFGDLEPGDIKYKDINGDGVINDEDEVVVGHPRFPEIIFGFNTAVSWKGLDLSMHWQGAARSSIWLRNEAALPFFNGAKAMRHHLDYWTSENRDASMPRLTPEGNINNLQKSSFWMRDGSYLRLKTLDIGYTLPLSAVSAIGLRSIRVYLSGQNLLTFSEVDFYDPEMSNPRGRYYFQQKVYSVGLNIDF